MAKAPSPRTDSRFLWLYLCVFPWDNWGVGMAWEGISLPPPLRYTYWYGWGCQGIKKKVKVKIGKLLKEVIKHNHGDLII